MPAGVMLRVVKHVLHVFAHNSLLTVFAVAAAGVYTLSLMVLAYITGLFLPQLQVLSFKPGKFKSTLIFALIITVSL